MTGEAAAELCAAIAAEVRVMRANGGDALQALLGAIGSLLTAPVVSPLDVLALAAMSRKLLGSLVGEFAPEEIPLMTDERAIGMFALAFLDRAVSALEMQTGISAAGFTGEAGTIN